MPVIALSFRIVASFLKAIWRDEIPGVFLGRWRAGRASNLLEMPLFYPSQRKPSEENQAIDDICRAAARRRVRGEAAGINLIGLTPHLVAGAVQLARASRRVIRQNLFWAFLYDVLMISLAALRVLPPVLADGAMTVSSLTVVLNALRLSRAADWTDGRSGDVDFEGCA